MKSVVTVQDPEVPNLISHYKPRAGIKFRTVTAKGGFGRNHRFVCAHDTVEADAL
jgi:hypothetical protein